MKLSTLTKKELLATMLLGVILVVVFVIMSYAQLKFAPVNDELANVPAGFNFLTTGRYTDPTHPPLLRYLFAVPLFIVGADPLPQDQLGYYSWPGYGKDFLFRNQVSWQCILQSTRTVVILLSLILLVLVYRWTKTLWGRSAAFAAVVFLALEPNFLGHGQLATLDAGFALAFCFSVFSLWRYLTKPSWQNFLLLHFATGVAFMTKFTAGSLFLSTIICIVLLRKTTDLHLKRFLLSPFILLFMIWAIYLFQMKSGSEDAQIGMGRDSVKIQAGIGKFAANLGTTKEQLMHIKIPAYDFLKGFGMQTLHAMFQDVWKDKVPPQYLMGAYAPRGWRSYFFWTFLLKSTIPTIALLGLIAFFAVASTAARASRLVSKPLLPDVVATCLAISPIVLFIVCSLGTINIGHRYILPVYPFLAMGAGFLIVQKRTWLRYTVIGLLLVHICSSCAAWPHHLSYFNELSRSRYYLVDSNIDWGQDLLYAKSDLSSPRVMATTAWGDLYSLVELSDLGIALPPIPDKGMEALHSGVNTVYLSVNYYLNRDSVHPQGAYVWLNDVQPTRKVGTSILVFEISK